MRHDDTPNPEDDDVAIGTGDDLDLGNGGNAVPPRAEPDYSNPILDIPPARASAASANRPTRVGDWAALDARYKRNAEIVEGLSDDEIRRVLGEVALGNRGLADFIAKRNPRTCPSCRRLIVDRLDQCEKEVR